MFVHRFSLRVLSVFLIGCSSAIAFADTDGVLAPAAWDRADADAGFAVFDIFTATDPAPRPGFTTVAPSPASSSGGGLSGTALQPLPIEAPGAIFGPPNADNRLYIHFSQSNWALNLSSTDFDINSVQLQVKESIGEGVSGALLNGLSATGTSIYDDGNGNAITSFSWALDSTIPANTPFSLSLFSPPFSAFSFDSFTVDASATVTAVPEPGVAGLLATGVLVGVMRRKRR